MKISTKTGDDGTTALLSGERTVKSDPRLHFLGTLDELNAHIGLVRALEDMQPLMQIQNDLFEIGTGKALSPKGIEEEIDKLEEELPELRNFILPGGNELASRIHLARAVCRRAERLAPTPSSYLNRLSDLLFLLARKANLASQTAEELWKN